MTSMDRLHELNRELYSAHTGIGFGVIASSKQTAVPTVGGWVELDRTTLGSAGDIIDVTSFTDKQYYMILTNGINTGVLGIRNRVGTTTIDTSSNYANRASFDGGADALTGSTSFGDLAGFDQTINLFEVAYVANLSGKEKLVQGWTTNGLASGASSAPKRGEGVFKWVNTAAPLQSWRSYNASSGSFDTGSEVVVLGWSPADTHTTNFWEELASVDLSGGTSETLDSGTFTAKKYLWVQMFFEASGGTIEPDFTFNSDTGNNYAERFNINGGTDVLSVSRANLRLAGLAVSGFANWFIVNNSATEKLVISNLVYNTVAGAATPPSRREMVGKWTNTSSQITKIVATDVGAGTLGTNTIMKVWGSD